MIDTSDKEASRNIVYIYLNQSSFDSWKVKWPFALLLFFDPFPICVPIVLNYEPPLA